MPATAPEALGASATAPVASAPASAATGPARKPLNVLLLTIDSMRADMPWAGYERDIAPNLTALAREGVVYDRAYSASSYTAKSVGTFLTGRYPSTLYRNGFFFTAYSPSNVFFTELLQEAGVRTMGGQAHGYFDRGKNLDQGFDLWRMVPGIKFNATTDESITSDKLTDVAVDMLSDTANTSGTFFLWLHYMDPHDIYKRHEESPDFGRKGRDLYDGEIYFTDLHVKRLLDYCATQPWWSDTAIIVSADHGEAFGEHKFYRHAFALWEVLVHVPWMFKIPGATPQHIAERRSHIDLAPTIMDLLGQKPDYEGFEGKTLVPELLGIEKPGNREPILLDLPADSHNPPTRAVIQGDYKLLVDAGDARLSLFDLKSDPGENKNLAKSEPDKLAEMRAVFDEAWAKVPRVHPWGGNKLVGGEPADGPKGPRGGGDDASKSSDGATSPPTSARRPKDAP